MIFIYKMKCNGKHYIHCSLILFCNFSSINHIPTMNDINKFKYFATCFILNNRFKNIIPIYVANISVFINNSFVGLQFLKGNFFTDNKVK